MGMSTEHALKHFYQQGILILLPHIKTTFGLTDVEIGLIGTSRAISSGIVNIPAAIITDLFRSRISVVLTASLLCMALGYFLWAYLMLIGSLYWQPSLLAEVPLYGMPRHTAASPQYIQINEHLPCHFIELEDR